MKYQAEYRTVSGKFFQRTFDSKESYQQAQTSVTGTKRQGVEQWQEEHETMGTLTFVIAMDKVEAVVFREFEEAPEEDNEGPSEK